MRLAPVAGRRSHGRDLPGQARRPIIAASAEPRSHRLKACSTPLCRRYARRAGDEGPAWEPPSPQTHSVDCAGPVGRDAPLARCTCDTRTMDGPASKNGSDAGAGAPRLVTSRVCSNTPLSSHIKMYSEPCAPGRADFAARGKAIVISLMHPRNDVPTTTSARLS